MKGYVLTVERVIRATPEAIFDILSDASKHSLIDGSGMLQGSVEQTPERLMLGSTFGMGMKMVMSYSTFNRVVEFVDNRQYRLADRPRRGLGPGTGRTDLALRARTRRRRDAGPRELGHHHRPPAIPAQAREHLLEQDPTGHGAHPGQAGCAGDRPVDLIDHSYRLCSGHAVVAMPPSTGMMAPVM